MATEQGAEPLSRLLGALLVLLGGSVMLGWWLQLPILVRVLSPFTPMVFSTASCFVLSGCALLVPHADRALQERVTTIIGVALVTITSLVLLEHVRETDLGIDWTGLHAWLRDSGLAPGRMSVPTAAGFLLGGLVLILLTRVRRPWARLLVRLLTLAIGAVGVFGLVGYLLNAQLLFPQYLLIGVAFHTAIGLLFLSAALWVAGSQFPWGRASLIARDDDRITIVAATVLAISTMTAGVATFAVIQNRLQFLVADNLLVSLVRQSETIQDLIALRELGARIAATRPAVIQNLRVIRAGRDDGSHLANVRAVVEGFVNQGIRGIEYQDASARTIAAAGAFARSAELSVQLATPEGCELLWDNGFVLRHRLPISDANGQVGFVVVEQALAVLPRVALGKFRFGRTGETALCVAREERLHCFPNQVNVHAYRVPLTNLAGDPLPMTRALRGETGTVFTRDYQDHEVVAAYGPVGQLGVGLVAKVDTAEIFQPIREQLLLALGLLVLLVAGGAVVLRLQIRPLAGALVDIREKLEERNVELTQALRSKDRFYAAMSHELRTPLNAIIGFTGTLLMKLPGPLNPEQEHQLKTVQGSATHLLSLINDLLDVAKVDAGKMELRREPIRCREFLEAIATTLRPLSDRKGLALAVRAPGDDLVLRTDARALNQILLNLVDNAIKFTEKGRVEVAVARGATEGTIEISVADTGIGIRTEDQVRLFAAFSQVGTPGWHDPKGTGLGLHLSQKLAQALGGSIELRSEHGMGSTFTVVLPDR